MLRIEISEAADLILAQVPGMDVRVEEMLKGIFQTAQQLRTQQGGAVDLQFDTFLRLHIDKFVVTYTLDLDRISASILNVERVDPERTRSMIMNESLRSVPPVERSDEEP